MYTRTHTSLYPQENFGRQEQHLEQHYNEVLQTLSQRYDDRAVRLADQKKGKLESLYGQLLGCGRTMDASKELIEAAQGVYRSQDPRLFLKVRSVKPFLSVARLNHKSHTRALYFHVPSVRPANTVVMV